MTLPPPPSAANGRRLGPSSYNAFDSKPKEVAMRRVSCLVLGAFLAVSAAWAGELAGVDFPDRVSVDGTELVLNGMGVRKKAIIKVYVAGLYVERASQDADAVVSSPSPKRVVMHFLTNRATKKRMDAAWMEGFEANSPSQYPSLASRVETFADLFGDMKDGDRITLTVSPGSPTRVELNGEQKGTIEGDDFGRALLLVWLGEHPPSGGLKEGLLGR
jgi:hypothetical protein